MRYLILLLMFVTACKTRCDYNFRIGSDLCSRSSRNSSGLDIYKCQSGNTYHNPPVYREICEDSPQRTATGEKE